VDLTRTVEDKNYAGGDEVGNNDYQSRKKNTKGRPFKVKPRSRHSLHMTFFFAGEVPCELPPDELRDWHSELTECFRESGLYPASQFPETKPKKTAAGNDNDFSFQLVGLSLFPPKRKNLIVAILEASPPWHELHNKVMKIAKQSTSEGIREITKRKGKPKWTAHITLANIVGGTKEDSRELSSYLENFSQEELNNEKDVLLTTRCISMGGPVPDQLDLDWTFHFPADEQS